MKHQMTLSRRILLIKVRVELKTETNLQLYKSYSRFGAPMLKRATSALTSQQDGTDPSYIYEIYNSDL